MDHSLVPTSHAAVQTHRGLTENPDALTCSQSDAQHAGNNTKVTPDTYKGD